jgi:hypothetical protein
VTPRETAVSAARAVPARYSSAVPVAHHPYHGGMSSEPQPGIVPEHLRTAYQGDPILLTVDGEDFRVRIRAGQPRTYDFDWLTGPHEYGFASSGPEMTVPEMEQAIRDFLAGIDPATGYLAE